MSLRNNSAKIERSKKLLSMPVIGRSQSTSNEFIDIVKQLQNNEMSDHSHRQFAKTTTRKLEKRSSIDEVLQGGPPYPMIYPTTESTYWIDSGINGYDIDEHNLQLSEEYLKHERDEEALTYRKYYKGKEHHNYYTDDKNLGFVLLSLKMDTIEDCECIRALLRSKNLFIHQLLPCNMFVSYPSPSEVAKMICEEISNTDFDVIISPWSSDLITKYEEHNLIHNYKFGIFTQRFGQTKEEDYFGNEQQSPALTEFLNLIADRVTLEGFKGFAGGLDVNHNNTGMESYYTRFKDKEIMFHVSTLLPYEKQDRQKLQRKRHIGNDIVSIVFQEENTPFSPNSIASHFLHVYVVVQPVIVDKKVTKYKVSVAGRKDVPAFKPHLPCPAVFEKGPKFREFLLTKLIAAEHAAYKAEVFTKLEIRTREHLLKALVEDLKFENGFTHLGITANLAYSDKMKSITEVNKVGSPSSSIFRKLQTPASRLKKQNKITRLATVDAFPEKPEEIAKQSISPSKSINNINVSHRELKGLSKSNFKRLSMPSLFHLKDHQSGHGSEDNSSICSDGDLSLNAIDDQNGEKIDVLKKKFIKVMNENVHLLKETVSLHSELAKSKEQNVLQTQELIDMHTEVIRLRATVKKLEKKCSINGENRDSEGKDCNHHLNNNNGNQIKTKAAPISKFKPQNDNNQSKNASKLVNTSTGKTIKEAPV